MVDLVSLVFFFYGLGYLPPGWKVFFVEASKVFENLIFFRCVVVYGFFFPAGQGTLLTVLDGVLEVLFGVSVWGSYMCESQASVIAESLARLMAAI